MTREEFQERHGIIGQSIQVQELVEVIQQVAPTDITVLITGESGTGKEVFAKAIHAASKRSHKPMITVNCGAIPEGIIESELFGHEKGAFTGAGDTRKGYFELADNGTIFLDEIGELPLGTQVKFLRVLENGEFMRVGSAQTRRVDVRVIAATNKHLDSQVRHGNFRADLFYRLRSINLDIPPLRQRREDIPLFVEFFMKEAAQRNDIKAPKVSPEAMALLQEYRWEGNVRELRNVIDSLLVLERGSVLRVEDVRKYLKGTIHPTERNLPVHLHKTAEQAERELIYRALLDMKNDIVQIKNFLARSEVLAQRGNPSSGTEYREGKAVSVPREYPYGESSWAPVGDEETRHDEDEPLSLSEMERRMITRALHKFHGNRRMAASALNISERTLYRKIKEYGLNGR